MKLKRLWFRYMYLPIIVLVTVVAAVMSQALGDCTGEVYLPRESEYIQETEIALEGYDASLSAAEMEIVDSNKKINLNTAGAALLDTLPGIGPVKAVSIVRVRAQMGGFRSVNDLLNVEGIGEKTLQKISDRVYID